MPTSVLLAVLAAAVLLALAPALVRRYDATERLEAARAQSTARVLNRTRRPRTMPGRRPVNPSRILVPTLRPANPPAAPADHEVRYMIGGRTGSPRHDRSRWTARGRGLAVVAPRSAVPARRPTRPRTSPAIYRRRRVLAALVLLNVVKLLGVAFVGPGFWVAFAVSGTLLLTYLVHLRNLALADRRQRRVEARRAAWLAALQAEVRRQQDLRAAERRAAARRMAGQRESLRRAAGDWSAAPTVSYRRASGGGG